MANEWVDRDDVSVFVVAGAKRSFKKKLRKLLEEEHGEGTEALQLKDDLEEWVLTRVRGHYRKKSTRSMASKALWRAYRALAAARYHVRGDKSSHRTLKGLRDQVEEQWAAARPTPQT